MAAGGLAGGVGDHGESLLPVLHMGQLRTRLPVPFPTPPGRELDAALRPQLGLLALTAREFATPTSI